MKINSSHISKTRAIPLTLLAVIMSACSQTGNDMDKVESPNKKIQHERYLADVTFISKMSRIPGSKHHHDVQNLCAKRFKDLGFQVELHDYGTGINVIGVYPGTKKTTEKIIVSAHYDTVPNCTGADDNASGIAGVFETARLLAAKKHNRTLVVACWDEEETQKAGSKAYVVREKNRNSDVKISYVYEMIGYKSDKPYTQQIPEGFELIYPQQVEYVKNNQNRGDFIALVYDELASYYLTDIAVKAKGNNLSVLQFEVNSKMKSLPEASNLRRSDHSAFWDMDIPAMMITDTANFRNKRYHCLKGEDNVESLDIDFAIKTVNTLAEQVEQNLN